MFTEQESTKPARANRRGWGIGSSGMILDSQLVNLLVIVVSLAATYFMTIQSLKIELAAKAESVAVETLDKKLVGLEVILKEGTVSKKEFYEFSRGIESRLDRIEQHLIIHMGEKSGNR